MTLDVSVGEVIGAVSAIAGVAATWVRMSARLRDQGRRIGKLEDRASTLEGYLQGARVRRKTLPAGEATK